MSYCSQSREEVFTRRSISSDMNIRGKIREACDGPDHPASYPVIIGLDVTGSMGVVPERLIKGAFPKIMGKLEENGLKDIQVCFLGIGDHYCDEAPIQVGQFESSDELTEKWLKNIYLEGHGGGNDGESYLLAWYFAACHTKIDSYDKRGIKGTLITIGDEPNHRMLDVDTLKKYFGSAEANKSASEILEEAKKKWDVYHINVNDYTSQRYNSFLNWCNVLDDDHILQSETTEEEEICDVLSTVIIADYKRKNTNTGDGVGYVEEPVDEPENVSEPEPVKPNKNEPNKVVKHDL